MTQNAPSSGTGASEDHRVVEQLRREVSLGVAARQGAAWIGAARVATQLGQFLAILVTARLLLPSQFGEAAVALAVAAFAQLFTDLGLAAAIVHARRATAEVLATAFWLNITSGLALTALVLALAYPLSRLFHHPSWSDCWGSSACISPARAASSRLRCWSGRLPTGRLATYETSAYLLGSLTTPVLAALGVGTPSLVLGPLVTIVVLSAILWIRVPRRPDHRPTWAAATRIWRYSRGLVGFNVVNYWSRNIDTLLLGVRVSAHSLGYYTRAFNLTMIPVQQMNLVLGRVLFPSLTRMGEDRERMGRAWLKAVMVTGSLILPVTITLAAAAPALTYVLLGPRWHVWSPAPELLALATTPQIIASAAGGLFLGPGRGHRHDVAHRPDLNGSQRPRDRRGPALGYRGRRAAILVFSGVSLPVVLVPVCRVVGIAFAEAMRLLWPMFPAAAALGLGELTVRLAAPAGLTPWVMLPLQLAAGAVLYLPVLYRVNPAAFAVATNSLRGVVLRARRSSVPV